MVHVKMPTNHAVPIALLMILDAAEMNNQRIIVLLQAVANHNLPAAMIVPVQSLHVEMQMRHAAQTVIQMTLTAAVIYLRKIVLIQIIAILEVQQRLPSNLNQNNITNHPKLFPDQKQLKKL